MVRQRRARRGAARQLLNHVAVATVAISALSFVGRPEAAATSPATNESATTATPTLDLPAVLDSFGTSNFPTIYGGVVGVGGGQHIDIYLTTSRADVENAFEAAAAPYENVAVPTTLSFVHTARSLQSLNQIHQRLIDNWSSLEAQGIGLVEFWPDIRTGHEQIGVENLNDADTNALNYMFDSDAISVFDVTPDELPTPTVSRISDTAPYNGGDSITTDSHIDSCTSGFGITISGQKRFLTAAHCYPLGTTIKNAICYNTIVNQKIVYCYTWNGSDALMGTVVGRDTSDSGTDTEVVTGCNAAGLCGGSDLIFTGEIGNPQVATVAGYTTNPVGYQVCQSGSYSGETCGLVIDNNNTCLNEAGRHVCHLIHAYSPTQDIANEGGNSGGPVFRFVGGSLYATGIISASTGTQTVPCKYNTPNICYSDVYYTAINTTLGEWGASINTG